MKTIKVRCKEDLPTGMYFLPRWEGRGWLYRAIAWDYLNRKDGGDCVINRFGDVFELEQAIERD